MNPRSQGLSKAKSPVTPRKSKASIPLHMTQKMVLIVGFGMIFLASSAVFVIVTDTMPHSRVFHTVQSLDAKVQDAATGIKNDDSVLAAEQPRGAKMLQQFALSISHYAQQTNIPRGIVLPLFDDIAYLGMAMLLELRAFDEDVPIEIPHCGDDLAPELASRLEHMDLLVRVYDVCAQAAAATSVFNASQRLFCERAAQCERQLRGSPTKVLAVVFSRFEQVLLLDANTLFFQNPMALWDHDKYTRTGTLFFHDRVSDDRAFLAKRVPGAFTVADDGGGDQQFSELHMYLSKFDASPFRALAAITRDAATTANPVPIKLRFAPSDFLVSSHTWNLRAGHQLDSSLLLWNKNRQPRATAILASFVAQNGVALPPSDGGNELFFLACELAETQYAFSDFGASALGTDVRDDGEAVDSVLCGGRLHYFPSSRSGGNEAPSLLFFNSDELLTLDVATAKIYRSEARAAAEYSGSLSARGLPQQCVLGIRAVRLSTGEKQVIARRQQLHASVAVQGY
jgi:hypothetical protein|uniref:Nucleotide-diphospho-sugar transferase domain-containing protein n=1 Tax=Globisporangium ultimum (strain ATCC 200006 / CBS 805.95 / DAOM BR144) TaxID=431595 RepID=K3W5Z2_GLOUD